MTDQQYDILLKEALELSRKGLSDDYYEKISELRQLGSDEVFNACKLLCNKGDAIEQSLGADILGQFGDSGGTRPFRAKSIAILSKLLEVDNEDVLQSTIVALGYLDAESVLIDNRHFAVHPSPDVRQGMAFALCSFDSDKAIRILIRLSRDAEGEVRSWATFGLGNQCKRNTKAIRQALLERIDDPNEGARFEAFVGMARLQMPEIIPALIRELKQAKPNDMVIDAAIQVALPELVPVLTTLLAKNPDVEIIEFALKCCEESEE